MSKISLLASMTSWTFPLCPARLSSSCATESYTMCTSMSGSLSCIVFTSPSSVHGHCWGFCWRNVRLTRITPGKSPPSTESNSLSDCHTKCRPMAVHAPTGYYADQKQRLLGCSHPVQVSFGDLTLTEICSAFSPLSFAHLFSVKWLVGPLHPLQ